VKRKDYSADLPFTVPSKVGAAGALWLAAPADATLIRRRRNTRKKDSRQREQRCGRAQAEAHACLRKGATAPRRIEVAYRSRRASWSENWSEDLLAPSPIPQARS
jgi:hypothetical protein